jgi:hypothetical protein
MAISLVVKEAQAPDPIPEGLYKATVKNVEEGSGEYGDYLKFIFEISEGKQKGVERNLIASKKLSKSTNGKSSKLYGVVKALNKESLEEGQEVIFDNLVGKPCQILVKDGKEVDGIMFQNITEVMPA